MTLSSGEIEVELATPDAAVALADVAQEPAEKAIQGRSLGQIARRRLSRDKVAIVAAAFITFLALVAILARQLTDLFGQKPNTIHNAPPHDLLDASTQMPLGHWGGVTGTHLLGVTPGLVRPR